MDKDPPRKEAQDTPTPPVPLAWTLKRIGKIGAVFLSVLTLLGGFFTFFYYEAQNLNEKIHMESNRLETKIHTESKEIRTLVGENTTKLNVLTERVDHVRATTEKIDSKMDRLLMERKKTELIK